MKGLFLICTLISLVGFTNSLLDKERLAEVKENHQKAKKMLEKTKNDRDSIIGSSLDLFNDYINVLDQWMAQVKKEESNEDILPLMKEKKDSWVKTKSFIDKKNDELGIQIEQIEKDQKQNEKIINFLEEQQAEL